MNLANHFSDFIYKYRKGKKMSQIEVVALSGITRATYSEIENGRQITLENVEKVLSAHNLKLSDFCNYLEEIEG